jgi:XTP/dITP diphosphohydrolase
MTNKLFFNTINPYKKKEIEEIFKDYENKCFLEYAVQEILSQNVEDVVRAKAMSAYKNWRVPVIVEHGAICIHHLRNLPGALSKPMWDSLKGAICDLIPQTANRTATAMSGVGYCDGKIIEVFVEKTQGTISIEKKGSGGFQWDPIFIPDGQEKTYAEMTLSEKLKFSQAAKAYNELKLFLSKNQ